jgi:sarcosine oxidase subunit delta
MRLVCPYCGERDAEEFTVLGSVAGARPDPEAPDAAAAFNAYVHLRDNPAGPNLEHWYHSAGCRSWLVVRRDTRTHEILDTSLAAP